MTPNKQQDNNLTTKQPDTRSTLSSTATPQRDSLFAAPLGNINGFTFDEKVAAVFPDMLRRSIPGYSTIITQSGLLAERFAQADSHCYDLGCSLGATAFAMQKQIKQPGCQIIAVDSSAPMLRQFEQTLATNAPSNTPAIELRCEDITDTDIRNASVTALNFTLQFVTASHRLRLLKKIARGTLPGGALILSEKVIFADSAINDLNISMYHDFKRANGYSDLEISQKRTALENVLVPDTLEQHQQRLLSAGFKTCSVWFQCFNFLSLIALK